MTDPECGSVRHTEITSGAMTACMIERMTAVNFAC